MLHEFRVYDILPGEMGAIADRFANITLGHFRKRVPVAALRRGRDRDQPTS